MSESVQHAGSARHFTTGDVYCMRAVPVTPRWRVKWDMDCLHTICKPRFWCRYFTISLSHSSSKKTKCSWLHGHKGEEYQISDNCTPPHCLWVFSPRPSSRNRYRTVAIILWKSEGRFAEVLDVIRVRIKRAFQPVISSNNSKRDNCYHLSFMGSLFSVMGN